MIRVVLRFATPFFLLSMPGLARGSHRGHYYTRSRGGTGPGGADGSAAVVGRHGGGALVGVSTLRRFFSLRVGP